MEILNKSYEDNLELKKDSVIGFVVIEPEHLPKKTCDEKSKEEVEKGKNIKNPRQYTGRKRKRQYGNFLSRYEFA